MSILRTVKKGYISIKTASGYMKLLPRTLATLVSMSDGTSVENKISSLIPTVQFVGSASTPSENIPYQMSIRYPDGRMIEYGRAILSTWANVNVITGNIDFIYPFVDTLPIMISTLNNEQNSIKMVHTHVSVLPGFRQANFAAHHPHGGFINGDIFRAYYVAFGRWK